jgi:predicted nucleic acid-binding protein
MEALQQVPGESFACDSGLPRACIECRIHFLWRPHLPDPKDDSVLELALAGNAPFIVTHNTRHFHPSVSLGIRAVTPDEFLSILSSL